MTNMEPEASKPEAQTDAQPQVEKRCRGRGGRRKDLVAGLFALLGLGVIGAVAAKANGGPHGHGFGHGFGLERALKSVEATKEQRQEIWTIVDAAKSEIRPMVFEMSDERDRLAALLGAPAIDRAAVEALRKEALAKADAVSARATEALLDAAEKLTPEQRAELLEKRRSFGRGLH